MISVQEMTTSYCGVEAHQWWHDYLVWEKLLNLHPEVEQIIELGTGIGGFALYLSDQAWHRNMIFQTYDIADPEIDWLAGYFNQMDIWKNIPYVVRDFDLSPVILHCDGPDKPREIATFAPYLDVGSLAVIHDYGYEFFDSDIPERMERVHGDLSEGGLTCILQAA